MAERIFSVVQSFPGCAPIATDSRQWGKDLAPNKISDLKLRCWPPLFHRHYSNAPARANACAYIHPHMNVNRTYSGFKSCSLGCYAENIQIYVYELRSMCHSSLSAESSTLMRLQYEYEQWINIYNIYVYIRQCEFVVWRSGFGRRLRQLWSCRMYRMRVVLRKWKEKFFEFSNNIHSRWMHTNTLTLTRARRAHKSRRKLIHSICFYFTTTRFMGLGKKYSNTRKSHLNFRIQFTERCLSLSHTLTLFPSLPLAHALSFVVVVLSVCYFMWTRNCARLNRTTWPITKRNGGKKHNAWKPDQPKKGEINVFVIALAFVLWLRLCRTRSM